MHFIHYVGLGLFISVLTCPNSDAARSLRSKPSSAGSRSLVADNDSSKSQAPLTSSSSQEDTSAEVVAASADCPKNSDLGRQCRADENILDCGTCCPQICTPTRSNSSVDCSDKCVFGCYCKDYTIYSTEKKRCIPADDCPYCGPNEVRVSLTPKCPINCKNYLMSQTACQDYVRRPGCVCKNGFIRSRDGLCVMSDDCDGESVSPLQILAKKYDKN